MINETWQPSPTDREFAEKAGLDADRMADPFRDYHLAHGSLMASWPAAWRTWCRNQAKWNRSRAQRQLPLVSVVPPDPGDPFGATAWAASLPDARPGTLADGSVVMSVNGYDAAGTVVDCCRSIGLPEDWRGDLTHFALWLRDGVEPDRILAVIRSSSPGRKPGSWWRYDAKVRGQMRAAL